MNQIVLYFVYYSLLKTIFLLPNTAVHLIWNMDRKPHKCICIHNVQLIKWWICKNTEIPKNDFQLINLFSTWDCSSHSAALVTSSSVWPGKGAERHICLCALFHLQQQQQSHDPSLTSYLSTLFCICFGRYSTVCVCVCACELPVCSHWTPAANRSGSPILMSLRRVPRHSIDSVLNQSSASSSVQRQRDRERSHHSFKQAAWTCTVE